MSEEKIFSTVETIKASDDLMSFEGCPNRCRNGYYIDPYKHKRVRCEHCYEIRKKFVQERVQVDSGKSISQALRVQDSLTGYGNFDVKTLFPDAEVTKLESWSYDFIVALLQRLIERVSIGEPIVPSLLINLGRKAHSQNFISPFLVRSYISGLTTAPCLSALDVLRLRLMQYGNLPAGWYKSYADISIDAVFAAETCLVYMDAGVGEPELMAVKGLMQLRAWQGKGTIILTDYYSELLFDRLVLEVSDRGLDGLNTNTIAQSADAVNRLIDGEISSTKDLAIYVPVRYKQLARSTRDQGPRGSSMTGEEAKSLMSQTRMVGIK